MQNNTKTYSLLYKLHNSYTRLLPYLCQINDMKALYTSGLLHNIREAEALLLFWC